MTLSYQKNHEFILASKPANLKEMLNREEKEESNVIRC